MRVALERKGCERMKDPVIEQIYNISLRYQNIMKVVLFGSRARGDHNPNSDYDIAIFSNAMEHAEQSKFLNDIDGVRTLNKIDVVFIKERHKDTEFYKNIMKDGVTVMDKFQTKLGNYKNALARLHESIEDSKKFSDNLTFRDGVIQRFEFTAELAWKTIREYLLSEKVADINSPKSVMREAYHMNVITDEDGWIQILDDRNVTSHIYDEQEATDIYKRIATHHIQLFDKLLDALTQA